MSILTKCLMNENSEVILTELKDDIIVETAAVNMVVEAAGVYVLQNMNEFIGENDSIHDVYDNIKYFSAAVSSIALEADQDGKMSMGKKLAIGGGVAAVGGAGGAALAYKHSPAFKDSVDSGVNSAKSAYDSGMSKIKSTMGEKLQAPAPEAPTLKELPSVGDTVRGIGKSVKSLTEHVLNFEDKFNIQESQEDAIRREHQAKIESVYVSEGESDDYSQLSTVVDSVKIVEAHLGNTVNGVKKVSDKMMGHSVTTPVTAVVQYTKKPVMNTPESPTGDVTAQGQSANMIK